MLLKLDIPRGSGVDSCTGGSTAAEQCGNGPAANGCNPTGSVATSSCDEGTDGLGSGR